MYSYKELENIREKIMSQTTVKMEYNPNKLVFSIHRLAVTISISFSSYEIGEYDYYKHCEKIYLNEVIEDTELLNKFLKLMRRDRNLTDLLGDK